MTITLRPAGPLQQTTDGSRSRAFDICVNSRPVGRIDLATDPGFGPTAGVIRSLRVDEPDRGRGRGTVAVLAAEEVLRGWGCDQVLIAVPAGAGVALRMATTLGYTERGRAMAKRLDPASAGHPAPPPGVTFRPMTAAEFDVWSARSLEAYARGWAGRGASEAQARSRAEAGRRENLPDGPVTEGATFHLAEHDGAVVGHLWTGRHHDAPDAAGRYVFDIEVAEGRRGRGYGRALMLFAERIALERGERAVALHVFADNTPALRLYESLGYATTRVNAYKRLL
ncbi:GNAT family N-acetyltransferase [Streptomyces sp. HMX112]|uniref:GNAT family N-acetyltransferase n=1 Tax=Streptomyces sp. HMX112 TaxID=3390850 RepID=UPI003A7FD5D7